jgi:hypothetical protein
MYPQLKIDRHRLTPIRAVCALLAALMFAYIAQRLLGGLIAGGWRNMIVPSLGIVGTLATADAILKDLMRGPIIEQLNYRTYLIDRITKTSEYVFDFEGRRAIVPVESTGNESPQSMGDGGTLARPQIDTEQDAILNIAYHNGALELTDALIKQATGANAGAFVNKLERSSKKLADAMRKNINRIAYGLGNGVMATLTSSPAASTTFTVDSVQYLRVNQVIDVLTIATGAGTALSRTITAINKSTKTVTVDAAITATTTTDAVYKEGSRLQEFPGLRNISATGRTLHGINSATAGNQFWDGNQQDAASGVAGESLFEDLADSIGQNGQGEIEVFLTTRGIRKRLARTFYSQRRYNDAQATEIEGGYSAIHISVGPNRTPVIIDDDCPKTFVFALRDDALLWMELDSPDWLKDPKTDMIHWELKALASDATRRQAAWQCWFTWYASLASVAPNRTGRIINCADDAP